jgi:putative flippase GtrA
MQKLIFTLNNKYTSLVKPIKEHKLYLELHQKYAQIIKFAIAGASGAVVELGLFTLLVSIFSVHYQNAGILSTVVGILVNYIISQKWVFESGRYSQKIEFLAFIGTSFIGLILNQSAIWLLVDHVGLNNILSKAMAISFVAIFNFFTKKYLVFKN